MTTELSSRKLTLDDIADARAYERERTELRAHVIELKRRRRVSLGTVVTLMFENRDTMRYQIQEMARVERTFTDQGIQEELDVYNPLIPEPGQLCATLFIELTSDDQMREWLSKLVGIEHSVHYITFQFTPAQVAAFVDGVVLAIDHPEYLESVELLPSTISELRADLT